MTPPLHKLLLSLSWAFWGGFPASRAKETPHLSGWAKKSVGDVPGFCPWVLSQGPVPKSCPKILSQGPVPGSCPWVFSQGPVPKSCPWVFSHLVHHQLLLDVASHCIPDRFSLWKRRKSQVLLCFCCLSAFQHPWAVRHCCPQPHVGLLVFVPPSLGQGCSCLYLWG